MLVHVARAAGEMHQKGDVHRDICPSNILLTRDKVPKLSDFDLVRVDESIGGTKTHQALGKMVYAAPEALTDAATVTPAADVHSLGVTALFLLHGRELPKRFDRGILPFVANLECSAAVRAVLETAIAYAPDGRYQSATAFADALAQALAEALVPRAAEPT